MPSHFELTLGTDAGIFVVDTPARPAVRGRRGDAAAADLCFSSCSYFSRACSDGSLSVRKPRSDLLFGLAAPFAGSWVDGGGGGDGGGGDVCASWALRKIYRGVNGGAVMVEVEEEPDIRSRLDGLATAWRAEEHSKQGADQAEKGIRCAGPGQTGYRECGIFEKVGCGGSQGKAWKERRKQIEGGRFVWGPSKGSRQGARSNIDSKQGRQLHASEIGHGGTSSG
jgi:hypothetical protein